MSAPIASPSVAADAGLASRVAASRVSAARFIGRAPSVCGCQFNDVDRRFIFGIGKQEPPTAVADPLDPAGEVAVGIMAILHGALLVAEHERAEENLAHRVGREKQSDMPLRSAKLGQALQVLFLLDAAVEGRIGNIIEQALALRS